MENAVVVEENAETMEENKAVKENTRNAETGSNAGGVNSKNLIQPYGIHTAKVLNIGQFIKTRKVTHTNRYSHRAANPNTIIPPYGIPQLKF